MQRTAVKLGLWVALAGFALAPPLQAETLKLATIIPDDSAWTNNLKKFAQEVKEKTASRVEIKLYSGGVQGDEPDILRKIRVGQLQGGILTGSAMGSVYSDVRVLELPFNFVDDRALALKAMKDLGPYFAEGFAFREPEGVRDFVNAIGYPYGPWRAGTCYLDPAKEKYDAMEGCIAGGDKPLVRLWGDSHGASL